MKEPADAVSLNAARVPQFMADIDIHNLALMDSRHLSGGTGWGDIPTPVF